MERGEGLEVRFGGSDWVLPFWLERQRDPTSPDFIPSSRGNDADRRGPLNLTHTEATTIGITGHHGRVVVDPRGLVAPVGRGWALDWWIGADDAWHLPSRSVAARQELIEQTPVIQTRVRIPGGDAVQWVYAALGAPDDGNPEVAVIEVENRSPVPFALVFAIRPFRPDGVGSIEQIALEGTTVLVDKEPAVVLPKAPARWAASDATVDSSELVRTGAATAEPFTEVRCADGLAQAAFVYPLPHTLSLRAVIPLDRGASAPGGRRGPGRGARTRASGMVSPEVPTAASVAAGWRHHADAGCRWVLPPGRLTEVAAAARCELLLAATGEDAEGPGVSPADLGSTAAVVQALDALGHHDAADRILAGTEDRIALDGHLLGSQRRLDANGALLVALGRHVALVPDSDLLPRLTGPIAKAAHWVDKRRRSRRSRRDPATVGLLPDGAPPRWTPGLRDDCWLRDDYWGLAGMRAAVALLELAAQPEAARLVAGLADEFAADLAGAMGAGRSSATPGRPPLAAAPGRRLDASVLTLLDVVAEGIDTLAGDVWGARLLEVVRDRFVAGPNLPAVVEATSGQGVSPVLTAFLARAELRRGGSGELVTPVERLHWMARYAVSGTGWPEAINLRSGGGSRGTSDVLAAATFLRAVRDLLVAEHADRLDLLPAFPLDWLGQGVELHGAPTAFGRLSFAIRWHGERPALLWELDLHPGVNPPVMGAPGLDQGWSSEQTSGEALLRPLSPDAGPFPFGGSEPGESSP